MLAGATVTRVARNQYSLGVRGWGLGVGAGDRAHESVAKRVKLAGERRHVLGQQGVSVGAQVAKARRDNDLGLELGEGALSDRNVVQVFPRVLSGMALSDIRG